MENSRKKIRTWIISDTHGKHGLLKVPDGIDMVIHAGDAGTYKNPSMNANGVLDFLSWYRNLDIPEKVFVAGNHDGSIEKGLIDKKEFDGIYYLEHEAKTISGLKFFGSPYTPSFHDWAFNVARNRLDQYWKDIPEDTDILITHGPAYGFLDLTESGEDKLQHVGCKSLLNSIKTIECRYHIFGHLHRESEAYNCGVFKPSGMKTTFINAAVLNLQYEICNDGIIMEI